MSDKVVSIIINQFVPPKSACVARHCILSHIVLVVLSAMFVKHPLKRGRKILFY